MIREIFSPLLLYSIDLGQKQNWTSDQQSNHQHTRAFKNQGVCDGKKISDGSELEMNMSMRWSNKMNKWMLILFLEEERMKKEKNRKPEGNCQDDNGCTENSANEFVQ